jgi:hypothetical protein
VKEKYFLVQRLKEEQKREKSKLLENERQKNTLLNELELMRMIRAQEVLQDLKIRGFKKIENMKISDLERKGELDYDVVMNFY